MAVDSKHFIINHASNHFNLSKAPHQQFVPLPMYSF